MKYKKEEEALEKKKNNVQSSAYLVYNSVRNLDEVATRTSLKIMEWKNKGNPHYLNEQEQLLIDDIEEIERLLISTKKESFDLKEKCQDFMSDLLSMEKELLLTEWEVKKIRGETKAIIFHFLSSSPNLLFFLILPIFIYGIYHALSNLKKLRKLYSLHKINEERELFKKNSVNDESLWEENFSS